VAFWRAAIVQQMGVHLQQLCCTVVTVRTMLPFSLAMHQVRVKPSRLYAIRTLQMTCFLVCSLPHRSFPLPATKAVMLLGFLLLLSIFYNDDNLALFVVSLFFSICCLVHSSKFHLVVHELHMLLCMWCCWYLPL